MVVKRRTVVSFLFILALFLLGVIAILSTIAFYLRIDLPAYITEDELFFNGTLPSGADLIPRIIHQTWKTEVLPERWTNVSQSCKDYNPDYEYMLWTDDSSREFIKTHYPWFISTFDAYTYPIQRADAIRYFVLYHYGGVYVDLDIGCLRPLDPLLHFPVVLPKTIPVGVSNDLMFSTKHHPFMEQTIHNLITFDHSYVLNYPTVMFSTGPMFLSAQFGLYVASHPPTLSNPGGDVRILPKSLYGKNARPEEAPHSFFSHHYGSSWHADDAGFITFLGKWYQPLILLGIVVVILGTLKLLFQKRVHPQRRELLRRYLAFGRYDIVLPRAYHRDGRYHVDFGFVAMAEAPTEPSSPISLVVSDSDSQISPISLDESPFLDHPESSKSFMSRVALKLRRVPRWVAMSVTGSPELPRRRRSRGALYFLPAIFTLNSSRSIVTENEDEDEDDLPLLPVVQSRDAGYRRPSSRPGSRPRSPAMDGSADEFSKTSGNLSRPPLYEDRNGNRSRGDRFIREGGWEE